MNDIRTVMKNAKEQKIAVINLGVPMRIFKLLNKVAIMEQKQFITLIAEAIYEKAQKLEAKHGLQDKELEDEL